MNQSEQKTAFCTYNLQNKSHKNEAYIDQIIKLALGYKGLNFKIRSFRIKIKGPLRAVSILMRKRTDRTAVSATQASSLTQGGIALALLCNSGNETPSVTLYRPARGIGLAILRNFV